jgi:hypothetical protein
VRTIRLTIAPATAETCGDGSGSFCQFVRTGRFGTEWTCKLFREKLALREAMGWLQRWPECIEAEEEK